MLRDGLKVAGPYASLAEAKAAGADVIAYGIVRDADHPVPDPGVGGVPDGQGDQSHAPHRARPPAPPLLMRRSVRQLDVADVMPAVPRIEL